MLVAQSSRGSDHIGQIGTERRFAVAADRDGIDGLAVGGESFQRHADGCDDFFCRRSVDPLGGSGGTLLFGPAVLAVIAVERAELVFGRKQINAEANTKAPR